MSFFDRKLRKGEVDEIEHAFEQMDARTDKFIAERIAEGGMCESDSYVLAARSVKASHAEIVAVLRETQKD